MTNQSEQHTQKLIQDQEQERKLLREVNRVARQAEIDASEKQAQEQRAKRQKALESVKLYLENLDSIDREILETEFVKETNLNPNDDKAFFDWIAERQDL